MKNEQEKTEWMQKPVVVWLGAMLCCFLWGSAFPCIKIGYKLWEINSLDTASQILFAGMRFLLAGILAIVLGSMLERRLLKPEQGAAGKILWLSLLQTVAQYMFLLYRTGTYKRREGVDHSGSQCVCRNPCIGVSVPAGDDPCQTDDRLSDRICRRRADQLKWRRLPYAGKWRGLYPVIDDCLCIFIRVPEAVFCKA